jgi:transglutaminase superfamily protein
MPDALPRVLSDTMTGVFAALRAPRVIDTSLKSLLDSPAASTDEPRECARSIRAAHRTLRLLAVIPGGRWRNTCLFRSVAECHVRRARGWPARLAIGVGSVEDQVIAHSWVEIVGVAEMPGAPAAMSPLRLAVAHDMVD